MENGAHKAHLGPMRSQKHRGCGSPSWAPKADAKAEMMKIEDAIMIVQAGIRHPSQEVMEAMDAIKGELCRLQSEVPRKLAERRLRAEDGLKNLLEAAEEMYTYCDGWHWKYGDAWKAAIDAAKAELERGK